MIKRVPLLIFLFLCFYLFFRDETFPNNTIKIGASFPKSGVISAWGDSVNSGANAYFNFVNENRILQNKKIEFISYDDKYEPELTKENINKLIFSDKVYALFGFVGTPTVKNILPIISQEDIPFFAAFTGASFLRNTNVNFVNFRSSYSEEIESLLEYLYNKKDLSKFAVFYQNDDYGEEGYIALLNSLEKRNLPLIAEGSYKRNTLSISHALNEIKDATPQAIIMVGAYKTNALFIKKAKENPNLKDTIFCNISFGDANEMLKELKKLGSNTNNLLFSQIVPNYLNKKIPVINEYQTLMKKYYPNKELGFISLEAFLSAKVLVNAIKKIQGPVTREKLLLTLKTSPKNLLEGLELDYKNSQLLNQVYLFDYTDEAFRELK